jgi:two-component system cell cycle sensor histidine kinase/response regulator CckA
MLPASTHSFFSAENYLDIAGVIFVALDSAARVTLINKRGCEVLQCDEDEILGKNWIDTFIPEKYRKEVRSTFKKLITGSLEDFKYYENDVLTCRGQVRTIAWRNTLLKDEQGKIIGTLSSGEDITERKKAEQALHESEERYRMLVETMNEGLSWMDRNYKLTYVNNKFCQMLGYPVNELIGKSELDFLDAYNRKILIEQSKQHQESGGEPYELAFLKKDGQRIITLVAPKPIYDSQKNFMGSFSVFTDITARKRAEEELQKSENMFKTLLESAAEAIMLIDGQGFIKLINATTLVMFGYTRDEILNNKLEMLLPYFAKILFLKDSKNFLNRLQNMSSGNTLEVIGRRVDGSEFMVEMSLTHVNLPEGEYLLGLLIDLTHRKRLEEQLRHAQKMEAVGQMAAGIAHQLNTPLSVIAARLQLLQDEFDENESKKYGDEMSKMLQNTERMASIITDLLSFSRDARSHSELLNLNKIVDEILLLINIRAKKTGIQIEKKLSRSLPLINADRSKVEQIFSNIAVNAFDAMPQGGKLTLSSGTTVKETKTFIWITFEDTGTGIPKHLMNKIMDPFFTTKPVGKGTGLGLAISLDFVKEHNGDIFIDSTEGVGTTVRVEFPVG